MTTRTTRDFGHQRTLRRVLRQQYLHYRDGSGDGIPAGEFRPARVDRVSNWNALFSNKKLMISLTCFVTFMISQLIMSYVGFLYFDLENRPLIFTVAQIYNIASSYFFPLVLAGTVEDNIDHPFESLNQEVTAFKTFCLAVVAQLVGVILGICATFAVFNPAVKFILIDWDFSTGGTKHVDVTYFLRFYQLLSLNLSMVVLVASVANCILTRDKILRYLNHIERTQEPFDDQHVYTEYLRTVRK